MTSARWPFAATAFGKFNQPWAMTFLPDGTLLVSERRSALKRIDSKGRLLKLSPKR